MPTSAPDEACSLRRTAVYYDGACPLCSIEINYYRRQAGADALQFVDVSGDAPVGCESLTKDEALKRFHIRTPDGTLVSGAAAFVEIWRLLPRWSWAARVASRPGVLVVLEFLYGIFLKIRPAVSRPLKSIARRSARIGLDRASASAPSVIGMAAAPTPPQGERRAGGDLGSSAVADQSV